MLGLPTWEGWIFICKSISGAHDDMTYFTFYKQSPERNVLQPRWKPYPLWRSRAPGTLTRDHPTVAEQPDHQSSDTGFLQKPTRLWDKRSFVTSSALPDIGASENQPRGGNSNPQNIVQAALAQLAAHFSRQSLRKTCGHASLNKTGRKFCPNVFLMVGFLWPGFSVHRLWVSP